MAPLTRRCFLKSASLSLFGVGLVPSFMRRAAFALEQRGPSTRKKVLVCVFQRGAADGLNIVVPFGEREYYSLRPSISIPEPTRISDSETAIDLDGFFGFHPSLTSLKPLFDARHLAVIHAAPRDRRTAHAPTLTRRTTWSQRRLDRSPPRTDG